MYRGWRIIRRMSAIAGLIILILAVGTSDFYVLELGQHEPGSVWFYIFAGLTMMAPQYVHTIRRAFAEEKKQYDLQDR